MNSFSLTLPAHVDFGRGGAQSAVDHARSFGTSILVVRSASAAFAGNVVSALQATGARVRVITGRGEPALPDLTRHLEDCAGDPPDCVLAIGGGSVIDLGKALAALIPQPGAPLDYLEVVGAGRALDAAPLPMIAVPTTAGTGAEATKNAVIGVPEHGRKVSLRDARMVPVRAIVDPALTDNCPRAVTLASGLDAVTQVIEPYLSARANPVTDAICRDAIPRGIEALDWLMSEESPEMRDELAYVSLSGGIALANAGLGAVHGLAGVIGGRTGMAHGALCGRLLVPVLRANAAALEAGRADTSRMDWVLRVLADQFGVPKMGALDALQDWIDGHGLPYIDRPDPDLETREAWVDDAAASSSMKANPVVLSNEALMQAVSAACAAPRA